MLASVAAALIGMGWKPNEADTAAPSWRRSGLTLGRSCAAPCATCRGKVEPEMAQESTRRSRRSPAAESAQSSSPADELAPAERPPNAPGSRAAPAHLRRLIGQKDLTTTCGSRAAAREKGGARLTSCSPASRARKTTLPASSQRAGREPGGHQRPRIDQKGQLRRSSFTCSASATSCSSTRSTACRRWSRRTSIQRWRTSSSICSSATVPTPRP